MSFQGKSLLVVDDNRAISRVLECAFAGHGATVAVSGSLKEATKELLCRKQCPDLVFLDYILPDGNSMEFFRQIVKPRNIPALMISGYANMELARTFLGAGGADILSKPFDLHKIEVIAREILMNRKEKKSIIRAEMQITMETGVRGRKLCCARDAYEAIRQIGWMDREVFIAIHLDSQDCVIQVEVVAVGTLSGVETHQRELFKAAIRNGAASLVVAHNHPSGQIQPSPEDIDITTAMMQAGQILGIPLRWHLLVAGSSYVDLMGSEKWPFEQ